MNTEPILASVGEFCPNAECGLYQQLDRGNIVKFGKRHARDVSAFACKQCQMSFSERKGTLVL